MGNIESIKNISEFEDKSLLIVDDEIHLERLARAMEKKDLKFLAEGVKGIDAVKIQRLQLLIQD